MSWRISLRPFRRWLFSSLCLITLSACGTVPNRPADDAAPGSASQAGTGAGQADAQGAIEDRDNTHDPLEGFNRAMYTFNDKFDRYLLKPVAKGYRAITPKPVRKSVSNFFSNLHEPMVMLNNLLQGKPAQAASDLGRLLVNSTGGIVGLFDVATKLGLPRHNEDFGQTLAVWGVGDGPYLVLPFFGPSNMRDGPALVVDWETYPPNHMKDSGTRDKMYVVEVIDKRAQLLDASDILEQAAGQDPYIFVREASRQSRRNQIYDGNPPQAAPPPGLFEDDTPAPAPRPGNGATQSR
ncbi:VacJ family lipoprotein [Sulfuricaulis sp.]|jgi:phospholipid-binding lipoprotein MlaA|uniref:MlaA family lipoprotein n=1 Tax=Sulfuricaulis sp. TaxID=2003553 RepID=UPI003559626F